jgi:hypothetical protein
MKIWSFKVFVKRSGRDSFEEWLTSIDVEAEERIRAMIRRLSVMEKWEKPYFSGLKGYKDIYEIRVNANNVQYRPLGCFGPERKTFVLLIGASKTSKKRKTIWSPKNAPKTANKRRELILEDRRYVGGYQP